MATNYFSKYFSGLTSAPPKQYPQQTNLPKDIMGKPIPASYGQYASPKQYSDYYEAPKATSSLKSDFPTIGMTSNLTDVPKSNIYDQSNLTMASETEKQNAIAGIAENQTDDLTPYKAGIDNQLNSFKSLIEQSNKQSEAYGQDRSNLTSQLMSQLEALQGKGQAEQQLREQAGIPQATQQLMDLNEQMASLSTQFDAMTVGQEGRGRTKIYTAGKQAQIQRQKAVELGGMASAAQALQGNITLAKELATETVNLQFAPLEQAIENTRELIGINYQDYTNAQKKEADTLQQVLDERERLITEDKNEQQSISDLMIAASQNGADTQTLQNIMKSGSINDAILSASSFLSKQLTIDGSPQKIGTDSNGKDLFYYNGGVITGDELLGRDIYDIKNIVNLFDPDVENWAKSIRDGKANPSDVPSELRTDVNSMRYMLPPSENAIKKASDMISALEQILNSKALDSAVGSNPLARFGWSSISGEKETFLSIADSYISKQALQSLIDSKSQGATFGALSDRELSVLSSAATSLGSRAMRNKDGVLTGFDLSQSGFKQELTRMINDYKEIITDANKIINDPIRVFNQGGSGTPTATLSQAVSYQNGQQGGQCGRFVNNITGLGLGDSYSSKMSKMDNSIKYPAPGMVFVMPYKQYGHTGIILDVKNGMATVKDSNYGLDEKVKTHQIPVSKMTGFTYA